MTSRIVRRSLVASVLLALAVLAVGVLQGARAPVKTSVFGSLSVVQVANADTGEPAVIDSVARSTALAAASARRPDLTMSISASQLLAGLLRVKDSTGMLRFEQDSATNAWVIQLVGPAQGGYSHVAGLVIVDAETGLVSATSIVQFNDLPAPPA